ncbi:Rho-GTPase-activating protein 8 [Vermiconidia calcicola]|uniref:Rho-GTPase-activating protein 8 n=1 Tax=Vermiconidia calcicola TaxID=1690605 RepID=A0ACC3NFA1_9PEZI|nr:Rho-GTPase-activating protein 8 [Vermiconidia calcicola]
MSTTGSSFSSSFWSSDYAAGLGVLFGKLQQGVQENEQILTVARMRADAEDVYGARLLDIEAATNRIDGGFQRDDGASVKKAYEGVRIEMGEAARSHRKIGSNIRELVLNPFARWCEQHAARVQNSQDDLQGRIRSHDRQAETVRQYRSAYYNKCRRVEDVDEEEKLAFQEPATTTAAAGTGSPKPGPTSVPSIKVEEEEDEPEPIDIGDQTYQPEQVKKMLTHLLETIRLGETKVPILGTYQNVTSGAEIVEYIQKHMGGTTVAYAEKIGQDLINNGFLRLVGNMGNTFANSSKMNYQWRTKAFQITGIPEKRPKLVGRTTTVASIDSGTTPESPVIGDRVSEMWSSGWNPLVNAHPNETPAEKLRREARDADERYKGAVRKLDGLRCNLEEAIIDHLKFMERCELDRLKAIKSVILDFSGAISNVIPSLQSTVDNMMLFQETVQPLGDLRYLLENYRTGSYIPKVVTYENYYNKVEEQTFGVDIEARARADRKRVPLIVTTILTFLDSHYPDLEGDEARRSIWVVDVPLSATHHLRNNINTGKQVQMDLLEKYEVPIVASALKLYLLELPDSLVSSHVYEIVKTIYTSTQSNSEQARLQVIQSTLGQLRLANIATLDAIITHFTRLIDLTSADDTYVTQLATTLAPCIMRPKQETGLSMAEKFNVRLIKDLFGHKDAIFGELKRQASLTHTNSGATRPNRAISTDESKRKEAMEERQRAIAAAQHAQANPGSSRSRQPSPGPGSRVTDGPGSSVRRERSRGPETRFPISTANAQSSRDSRIISPTSSSSNGSHRDSLGVPQSPPATRQTTTSSTTSPPKQQSSYNSTSQEAPPRTNGTLHQPPPAESDTPPDSSYASRERSSTEATKRTSNQPAMSASLSGPGDFMSPTHYYSASLDSPKTQSSIASNPADVQKKDSLSRTRHAARKQPSGGGLARQSLVSDSTSASADSGKTGVQLEDKPVDFD